MFKRMLPWLTIVLVAITLIVFAAFLLWSYLDKKDVKSMDPNDKAKNSVESVHAKKKSASEIRELTVEMNDMLTNLSNKDFIKISFTFELENEDVKEEFELLDFKVKDIVIQTLSDLSSEQIQGSEGKDYLSTLLINKINTILSEGKLVKINITNFVLS